MQQINSLNSDEQEKTQQPKTYSYFGGGGSSGTSVNFKPVRHEEEKGSSPYTAYLEKINPPVIKPSSLLEGKLALGSGVNNPRNLIISKSAKQLGVITEHKPTLAETEDLKFILPQQNRQKIDSQLFPAKNNQEKIFQSDKKVEDKKKESKTPLGLCHD